MVLGSPLAGGDSVAHSLPEISVTPSGVRPAFYGVGTHGKPTDFAFAYIYVCVYLIHNEIEHFYF